MSLQTWQETLISAQASGSLYATYTSAKTVLPSNCLITFPPNYFYIGRMLRITVAGAISNIATTPGTIVFQHMLGAVIAFTTGTMQLSTTVHTTLPFWMQSILTCQVVGSGTTAKLMGQAVVMSQTIKASAVADGTETHDLLMGPNSAPAQGTGWDSTASQTLDFFVGFSSSQGGNGVQVHQYLVESLN